jgi:hypothetical protein
MDAWVRPVDVYTKKSILSQDGIFDFGIDGENVYLSLDGFPTFVSAPQQGVVEQDVWTHVCVVYNGSGFLFFINGLPNTYQTASGNGTSGSAPFVFGKGFCGAIKQVRVFKATLDSDAVKRYMLQGDLDDADFRSALAAYYDFSQIPAAEALAGGSVAMKKNARQDGFSSGALFSGNAFIEIDDEPQVNPAGGGNDAYTVQSWVYPEPSDLEMRHVIFANGDVMDDCGMTLYIEKEGGAYKAKSLRADDFGDDSILVSNADIPVRQWVNIATTYDGAELRLYINGVLDNSMTGLFPLAQTLDAPLTRIGSEICANNDNGQFWFSGAISRLDVWNVALDDGKILEYAGTAPLPWADNLSANYNFHLNDNTNVCTGMPASGHNNLTFGELRYRIPKGAAMKGGTVPKQAGEPLSRELLAQFRAEALNRKRANAPRSFPGKNPLRDNAASDYFFTVTSHKVDGTLHFVAHDKTESYTMCVAEESIDPVTQWWIELFLILIGGAIDILFGIKVKANGPLTGYLTNLAETCMNNPEMYTSFGRAADWTYIKSFLYMLFCAGSLKETFRAFLSGVSWWRVAYCVAKIVVLVLASAVGSWLYYVAALTILTGEVIYHIGNYPQPAIPTVGLAAVAFHNESIGAGKSLTVPLRRDNTKPVKTPEWKSGKPDKVSQAAYCVNRCAGAITVRASFQCGSNDMFTAKVKCEDVSEEKLFGNSNETVVNMQSGASQPQYANFIFPAHKLGASAIGCTEVRLKWSYYDDSAKKWTAIIETRHDIYTLLDMPEAIWDFRNGPWVAALDYACLWAKGETTKDGAAKAVTRAVNGALGLKYDIAEGAPYYTELSESSGHFRLSDFLKHLGDSTGSSLVNCMDCATIVATFANTLGCNLSEKRMGSSFKCNPIIAIGCDKWEVPFASLGGEFSYHEVSVFEPLNIEPTVEPEENNYRIYDACLHLDGSTTPGAACPRTELLPAGIIFSEYSDETPTPRNIPVGKSYREHLATNDDNGVKKCIYSFDYNRNPNYIYKSVI